MQQCFAGLNKTIVLENLQHQHPLQQLSPMGALRAEMGARTAQAWPWKQSGFCGDKKKQTKTTRTTSKDNSKAVILLSSTVTAWSLIIFQMFPAKLYRFFPPVLNMCFFFLKETHYSTISNSPSPSPQQMAVTPSINDQCHQSSQPKTGKTRTVWPVTKTAD